MHQRVVFHAGPELVPVLRVVVELLRVPENVKLGWRPQLEIQLGRVIIFCLHNAPDVVSINHNFMVVVLPQLGDDLNCLWPSLAHRILDQIAPVEKFVCVVFVFGFNAPQIIVSVERCVLLGFFDIEVAETPGLNLVELTRKSGAGEVRWSEHRWREPILHRQLQSHHFLCKFMLDACLEVFLLGDEVCLEHDLLLLFSVEYAR